jgi:hypothetical protein
MHRAVIPLVLSLVAAPGAAQSPTIRLGIACNGPVPVLLEIEATAPALVHVTVDALFAWCAAEAPTKSKWRAGA